MHDTTTMSTNNIMVNIAHNYDEVFTTNSVHVLFFFGFAALILSSVHLSVRLPTQCISRLHPRT